MNTSKTIQISQYGGPEVLQLVELPVGEPGPGEIRIRHHACGLNFIDVYQRTGLYPIPLPLTLGMEGAGIVEAVGEGVTHLKAGDRAAYASNPPGRYSEARVMPAQTVVQPARRHRLRDRRGDDAEGPDRAVPAEADAAAGRAAGRRLRAVPCRRRRRRPDRLPVGQGARPAADRHGRQRRPSAQLALEHGAAHAINYAQGGLRRARQGDHRRQGREGGLRLGRQGHLRGSRSTACGRSA